MSSFISIGCECGGPEARHIAERKVALYQALSSAVTSTFCSAIDEYALVLRVDGRLAQYGPEGVANVRFAKTKRHISADLQIPETTWRSLVADGLDAYLAKLVELGLEACIARLTREGQQVDSQALVAEVQKGIAVFLRPALHSRAR
jgi:hypothetical protein